MRVKPIFKYSLLASALALPVGAYALGLGRLTVESFVGQPLVARIELLSASKEELDTLSAKIADTNLYRQNNLTYQAVLARTRITLERGPNDTAFLRVTSNVPVSEPYLDLMVEANWSAGRVVRDYTFLLDPPGSQIASVDPITPVRPGTAAPAPRTQQPAPAPAASAATTPPAGAAPRGEGGTYEVKRGDTLSKIAAANKPETVTLDQMLVALFKSNASAFDGNNMNRLRTGAILTIPNAVEASASSARESTREVQVQASDWRTYRDRVAGAAPSADESTTRTASGRIGTTQETTPATRPGSDQLRVSKGGTAAAESSAAQAAALREAQSRVAELEKTVKDMQRALELRNQTMAQLQAQAGDKGKTTSPPPTPPAPITTAPTPPVAATTPPTKAPEPAKVEPPKATTPEPAKVEPPKATAPAPTPPEPPKATAPAPTPPEPAKATTPEPAKVEPPKPAVTEPPKVVDPSKATTPPPPKPAAKAPPKEAPGFFEELINTTPSWVFIGGIVALIAALVAIFAARRRKTTKFEDSIISGTDIKTNTVFGSTGGGVVNTGDNSLASDFSREGLGNIDTDEVDPIAEAEVYLAYGRDAQAEEILKDALKKDPQRQEIYLKLLEIHAQHNKPSAFETVASELYAVNNGQGEVWQKAVALGRQLDPANPMFAEGGAPAPRTAAVPLVAPEVAAADNVAIRTGDDGLAFQMDEEISISPTSGAKPKSTVEAINAAEADMDRTARLTATDFDPDRTMALPPHTPPATPAPAPVVPLHEKVEAATAKASPKFDLDFKLDEVEKPAPMQKPREPALETAAAAAGPGAAPAQLARPAAALELDKLDLAFDPERSTFEDPTPSVLDGQWHDAATKLDLAKAYQEMGDVEGAREILQEVLHEGDDQQKAEAKSLLAKLG
jgi:pilus assembly protein FimV